MDKPLKPEPAKFNRYGEYNEYKAEILLSTIQKCLKEGKKTIVFLSGVGHTISIKDALLEELKKRKTKNMNLLQIKNIKNHKNTNEPTDVSIAMDGSGFDSTEWMEQSHVNIMLF